jgi:uncharacterized protein (DUF934 family)
MQILKDGVIAEDRWRHLADDEAPAGGAFTVSLPRWQAEKESLSQLGAELGVRLRGEDSAEAVAEDLPGLGLVVVEFPALADGRGFSIARILRDRYRYEGEIRARGFFIRDQVYFLGRVGVNAFECAECADLESLVSALTDFSVNYQAAADDKTPLYRKRA